MARVERARSSGQGIRGVGGGKWFERNRAALDQADPQTDLILRLADLYELKPRSVLEIGASNGFRLAVFAARGSRAVGVEPSEKAILDGRARFPGVELRQGLVEDVPVDERFDLVIVNFVFHWIDRASILGAIAEVDRTVADGGYLFIGDFLPSNLVKRQYHHLPGQDLYTFKQDYAAIFTASGLYHRIALLTGLYSRSVPMADVPEGDRSGTWLLQKSLGSLYTET